MKEQIKKFIILIISAIILVGLDQWTKFLATTHLKGTKGLELIPDVFHLYYSENRGAAFGMLHGKQIFLIITTVIILICIFVLYSRIPNEKKYVPIRIICITITAGALGNFIDRLRLGYVVDFLYFKLTDFPIFNIADCYVTISATILIILFLFYYKEEDLDFLFPKKSQKELSENGQ